jgi:hypothetical protein
MPGNMFRQLNNNQSMAVVHGELSSRCRIEKLAFRYVPVRKEEEQRLKLHPSTVHSVISLFGWLVADGWCWFVLREEYCWLVAGG